MPHKGRISITHGEEYIHRALFASSTASSHSTLKRLRQRWLQLQSKRVSQITARHAFVSDSMARLAQQNAMRPAGSVLYQRSGVIRRHGEYWATVSPTQRQEYARKAERMRSAKALEINQALEEIATRVDIENLRVAQQMEAESDSMRARAATLDLADALKLNELFRHEVCSLKNATVAREKNLQCPEPVAAEQFSTWRRQSELPPECGEERSSMYKCMAWHREVFKTAVIHIRHDSDDETWFRFLFSLQNPLICFWLPLLECDTPEPEASTWAEWATVVKIDWSRCWSYDPACFTTEDIFQGNCEEDISVYMSSTCKSTCMLTTHDLAQPLGPLGLALHEEYAKTGDVNEEARQRPAQATISNTTTTWMKEYIKAHGSSGNLLDASVHPEVAAASDDTMRIRADGGAQPANYQELFEELEGQRQEAHESVSVAREQFRVSLLGGSWQIARTGGSRATYGHRVDIVKNSEILHFAKRFGLTLSGSYDMQLFGEKGSYAMTQLYILRMTHLFDSWVARGRPEVYPRDIDQLDLPEDIVSSLGGLPPRAEKRRQQLVTLMPA